MKVDGRDGRGPQNREKFFLLGGEIVREINVSCTGDPVHAGDKALTWETPAKRGRVNRYALLPLATTCTILIPLHVGRSKKIVFIENKYIDIDSVRRVWKK